MLFMSSPEQLLLSHFIAESIGLRRKVIFSSSESYSIEEVRFKLKKKSQTFRLLLTAHSALKDLIQTPPTMLKAASQVTLVVKNLPANARDIREVGSIPRQGGSPGGGHGNSLQYSRLQRIPWTEEPGRLQLATVYRVSKIWTRLKQLSTHTCTKFIYAERESPIQGQIGCYFSPDNSRNYLPHNSLLTPETDLAILSLIFLPLSYELS